MLEMIWIFVEEKFAELAPGGATIRQAVLRSRLGKKTLPTRADFQDRGYFGPLFSGGGHCSFQQSRGRCPVALPADELIDPEKFVNYTAKN